jgi:hypothetical protein
MLLKILPFALYTSPLSVQVLQSGHFMPMLRILCYNGSLVTCSVVMAAGPCFKDLALAAQKTPLQLLRVLSLQGKRVPRAVP